MTIEPGQRLLHYRLIEKIGEGGMGVVWKALDTVLDREVAIKLLPSGLNQDPDRRDNSIVGISYTVEQDRFRPGKEEVLFQSPLLARKGLWMPLAVLDRRTFVVPLLEAEPEPPHLNVILNWNREVAARIAEADHRILDPRVTRSR